MGRYLQLHIHPISVGEILSQTSDEQEILSPVLIKEEDYHNLYYYSGFPKPFLQASKNFYNRWNNLRKKQLFYEDIRTLTQIHEIAQMEVLAELLSNQVGQLVNYSSLSKKIQVTSQTIARWVKTLEKFYFCFSLKPWSKNITRSLIKEPKIYLWDCARVEDSGAKFENFVALHLLKAINLWSDLGIGEYELYYLRDKQKNEVDFLVAKDKKAWFLIEAKSSKQALSRTKLEYFQQQTCAPYAFQVVHDMEYIDIDCFDGSRGKSVTVPAKTFFSQI